MDIRWACPRQNMLQAQRLMDAEPYSDLYVLPEMWSTGFATNPEKIAHDEQHNEGLEWMVSTARERQCALSGSIALRLTDGTYRNRHYFVDGRQDTLYYYDKHHLFSYGHEDDYYTPGTHHTLVDCQGLRFLLLTCYDLRFPGWCRYTETNPYDAILLVANWPQARQAAWQLLTRARAIENQCFFIGANRVGDDHFGHYAGQSVFVDPIGRTMAQCRPHLQQALTVTLDPAELAYRRRSFQVLEDRDPLG